MAVSLLLLQNGLECVTFRQDGPPLCAGGGGAIVDARLLRDAVRFPGGGAHFRVGNLYWELFKGEMMTVRVKRLSRNEEKKWISCSLRLIRN